VSLLLLLLLFVVVVCCLLLFVVVVCCLLFVVVVVVVVVVSFCLGGKGTNKRFCKKRQKYRGGKSLHLLTPTNNHYSFAFQSKDWVQG